ncbi:hypothetical protein AA309_11900 [Microvirga vignae]|uniref:Uncharacterized protein n=1 Tax=Microvirga vignae TaxID=1225564 RepID=A0A0H1RCN0_9HYPH|nr:hypothetical protein [Microvirga vignae]KLK92963.1 hypothetical protein AA309_11900 [Microvirga vignae]
MSASLPAHACGEKTPRVLSARQKRRVHSFILLTAALIVFAGFYGALERLGWILPHGTTLAGIHGPIMICGLFGTLISLERAAALGSIWSYVAPTLSVLGSLALIAGAPMEVGALAYVMAAFLLAGGSLFITLQQPALFTGTLLFGALAWLAGNVLWLMGLSVPEVSGWWVSFLILTIAGERLEMSRIVAPQRKGEFLFLFAISLLAAGAQNQLTGENGAILFGSALIVLAAWLLRHDIARLNILRTGQTQFMAVCMMSGYAWLAIVGALLIAAPASNGFAYGAILHGLLVGFVLSMVFGHALIILPAVAGIRIRYSSALYGPLMLLHASMALRLVCDLTDWTSGRQASGIVTLFALVGLASILALTSRRSRRRLSSDKGQIIHGDVVDAPAPEPR